MALAKARAGEHVNGQMRRITPVRQLAKHMAMLGAGVCDPCRSGPEGATARTSTPLSSFGRLRCRRPDPRDSVRWLVGVDHPGDIPDDLLPGPAARRGPPVRRADVDLAAVPSTSASRKGTRTGGYSCRRICTNTCVATTRPSTRCIPGGSCSSRTGPGIPTARRPSTTGSASYSTPPASTRYPGRPCGSTTYGTRT